MLSIAKRLQMKQLFTWQLLVLLALYAIGFQLIFDFSNWLQGDEEAFKVNNMLAGFCMNYPNLILLYFMDYQLIRLLDRYFPWNFKKIIPLRLGIELCAAIVIVSVQVITINIAISLFTGEVFGFRSLLFSATIGSVINLVLITTMEFYLQYVRQYETMAHNQRLKRDNAHFQYEVLKNQLNPHFLFNSLNTLSSLVSIDQNRARTFIHKLSQVYRHVLEHRDKELIYLNEELVFTENYIFLLKTRFGADLRIDTNIHDQHRTHYIVPMTLQVLIENAVKHNKIIENNPLHVQITSTGSSLLIQNNLRPKTSTASWGIGLKNIQKAYAMHNVEIKADISDDVFQVYIPLLEGL